MQQHILSKIRTDRVTEAATERFFLKWLIQNLKKIVRDHLKY